MHCLPGIKSLLNKLRKYYQVAILSDADNSFLLNAIGRNQLSVDLIVSSEDARGYKPDQESNVFTYLLKTTGYKPEEVLHIGDSENDFFGARNNKIDFWMFSPFKKVDSTAGVMKVVSVEDIEKRLLSV